MLKKKKKVSLKTVITRAYRDKSFCDALLKNPGKALEAVGWTISAANMRTLRQIIRWHQSLKRKKGAHRLWLNIVSRGGPPPWPTD